MTQHQPMNHDQAKALARLVHTLRGDWDEPGIMDALGQARTKAAPPDLAIAAIRASQRAANRTPRVIALDGEHWRAPTPDPAANRYRPPRLDEECPRHAGEWASRCRACASERLAGDEPAPERHHDDERDRGQRATRWADKIRADHAMRAGHRQEETA